MAKYNNKRAITLKETVISSRQILEGMVISFRYKDGFDSTPLVLVLYNDRKTKRIEGINLNYITVRRIEKLFESIKDENVPLNMDEMIAGETRDTTRVQLSSRRRSGNITPKKFYKEIIKGDTQVKTAYRSYKLDKVSSIKAIDVKRKVAL